MRCFLGQSKCRVQFRQFWCLFLAELFNKPWEEHTAILENVAGSIHLLLTTTVLIFQGSECSCRAMFICKVLQLRGSAIKHSEHESFAVEQIQTFGSLFVTLLRCVQELYSAQKQQRTQTEKKRRGLSGYWAGRIMVYLSLPLYSGSETHWKRYGCKMGPTH